MSIPTGYHYILNCGNGNFYMITQDATYKLKEARKMRISKNHPMKGSLSTQFRPAEYTYDSKAQAYFLKDTIGKKRYGPFQSLAEVERAGYTFYIDGGDRAKKSAGYKPATKTPAEQEVKA